MTTTPYEDFLASVDRTLLQAISLQRSDLDVDGPLDPDEATTIAMLVGTNDTYGQDGAGLIAVGAVDLGRDSLTVTLHGFRDGVRVPPSVMVLGDEIIVTLSR
jgi:hypothetical protein